MFIWKCFYEWNYPKPSKSVSWETFLRDARPGDIILISTNSVAAVFEEAFMNEPYSHVALVCEDQVTGNTCIAESSYISYVLDKFTNTLRDGPMIVDMQRRLEGFKENEGLRLDWRPLVGPVNRIHINNIIWGEMRRFTHVKHNTNIPDLVSAAVPEVLKFPFCWSEHSKKKLDGMFCSELTYYLLRKAGVCVEDIRKHRYNYAPLHFSEYYESIPFAQGVRLGKTINII